MSKLVSPCLIRVEVNSTMNQENQSEDGAIAAESFTNPRLQKERERNRGLRNINNITVQSYINKQYETDEFRGLFPTSLKEVTLQEGQKVGHTEFPKELDFFSGNPYVEVTKGIIHLYKKNERKEMKESLSNKLCLLAVPASLSCHDLLKFVAPCHSVIKHIRIIRDESPNQFMVILEFRSNESAIDFYRTYNGSSYNSLEPDTLCHSVWVSSVEWGANGAPPEGHTELPTCPVCLERMDESIDGVLTILCNHAFHSNCLMKWGDSTCPVCRYVQTPELMEDSVCMGCEGTEALWICLICGHVGCGRYQGGHAASHYRATNHTFAMQLGTSRVWDYVGDNFVHRLFKNKSDGKLVATQSPGNDGDEKIDSMQLEFTYLLTSQLDAQRKYYEERFNKLESDFKHYKLKNEGVLKENILIEQKYINLVKEKSNLEKKLAQNTLKLKEIQKELADECQVSKALQSNQLSWQNKYMALKNKYEEYQTVKERELMEIKDQLRDIMFYMQAQTTIAESDMKDEIATASVIIPEPHQPTSSKQKVRRKKNKN